MSINVSFSIPVTRCAWRGSSNVTSYCTSAPVGTPQNRHHWFKVVAPDADTDLVITVKDDFGHTYTETMERPKKFDVATYKIEIK